MPVRFTKNGKRVGRPNGTGRLRTPEHADYICNALEAGRTLRQIAQDLGFTQSQISQWGCGIGDQPRDDSFINRYARSLSARWEAMAEQVIEIAEEIPPVDAIGHVDSGWVQNQRLRIDTKKWLLSKALPKKYGERVEAMVTGDPNAPLLTRIELVAVPPRPIAPAIEHDPDPDSDER